MVIVSESEFPKSTPPRFALPEHDWMFIGWQNFKEEIRVVGEWRLVRKIKFVPSAEWAKQNLKRPAKKRVKPPRRFSKDMKDALMVSDVMLNLVSLIDRGLAEKQAAKDENDKLPKFLRKKPGATLKEIRDAAGLLHYLVSLGCSSLMEIAQKHPEILRPIAREHMAWPLMMSKHPGYKVNHIQLLKSLHQGDAGYYDADQTSRDGTQRAPIEKGTRETAKRLYLCLLSEWMQTQSKLDGNPVAEFWDDEDIASAWWEVAKARLLEAYPEPHIIPELARIAAPSRKFPAHIRGDILRRLETAFRGLAKNQIEMAKLAADPAIKTAKKTVTP